LNSNRLNANKQNGGSSTLRPVPIRLVVKRICGFGRVEHRAFALSWFEIGSA
jgi:hypothetical protein